ncbi:MAG: hypothetical protein DWQ31_20370 [Planctomycetota bacterium]|nr:MAG: hypothetical protein DWQ31_20370 [Planctomycetota bacterium]REJ96491.1 MAG: hypothetical protein DWQ35_04665 [Planctomycetota bacterium]REK25135.1 MAG: hypothetical protein DWQ42_12255 [Planctomycetota bacterium]REK40527.1 MAG: hypothetical protein DWQ46_16185 [Planctomycetota bacterium]
MSESKSLSERQAAETEHRHHHYVGSRIPWYVRLIWIGFWTFAVYYTIRYLVPALREELFLNL